MSLDAYTRHERTVPEEKMSNATSVVVPQANESALADSGSDALDPYNLNLQIAGVFIIIATSFAGMGLSFL